MQTHVPALTRMSIQKRHGCHRNQMYIHVHLVASSFSLRKTRYCIEPLTSCQYSAIFCSTKKSQSKMYTDVHFQNGHGCPGWQSAASFSLEKLVVEPCTRRYTAQQRHGRRRISFFPFVFRYAAVLERERKNLPPMMQEREKDWSRRPVFALFELLLLQ